MNLLKDIDTDVSTTGQVSQTTIELARKMLDQSMIITPSIGTEFNGGRYAGIIHDVEKGVSYHLIYADSYNELFDVTQPESVKFIAAEAINAFTDWRLPTAQEALMLMINASDSFDLDERYWTSTDSPTAQDCAYTQTYGTGKQLCISKTAKCRGRAVRTEPIVSTQKLIKKARGVGITAFLGG
jgi:hypothetical protein